MDATQLREQVQDVVRLLASTDPNLYTAVKKHLAPDAVLELPIHRAIGPEKIQEIVALHATITTDNTIGDVKWDEETKTATFAAKTTYCMPLSGGRIKFTVQWRDVTVKLAPDNNHPAPAHTAEPSKYHIAKVSKPAQPPRHSIFAAPYHIFLFLTRLVAPYVFAVLVTVMKFFERNPLNRGVIRTTIAAIREILQWWFSYLLSWLPFSSRTRIGTVMEQHKSRPTIDAPQSPRKAPDVDLEEKPEHERQEAAAKKSSAPKERKATEKLENKHFNVDQPGFDANLDVVEKVTAPQAEEKPEGTANLEDKSFAEAVKETPDNVEDDSSHVVEDKSFAEAVKETPDNVKPNAGAEVVEDKSFAEAVEETPDNVDETHSTAAKETPDNAQPNTGSEVVEDRSFAEAVKETPDNVDAPIVEAPAAPQAKLAPIDPASQESSAESSANSPSTNTPTTNTSNGGSKKNKKKKHNRKQSKQH